MFIDDSKVIEIIQKYEDPYHYIDRNYLSDC